ncbi:MAG: biopolymer transporter ExbB [gamma proteobacterium symbiont of Stewartia floridana]|uniref:MotA/TolQ/ExbB proton channel family protein n=1 Tax=Candidatus Thiodiazotropha taylori TaxID=2792791 RepID=A0A9E4P5W1_9GAMM|nr:MotA/TolQ/ExbB proton channel family protein [Candidatus Thiodiazotropha taylori]MCG7963650.1 MotA/TolQ/ExbB proton channel family protein [Candidatus Thiodiazotropha endolucinida]RLW55919.1 MAG: biopolymer transporter ExbB [gamma proteobacterium symbiont of Stewartia floridana]MCG7893889.1 MotA/TolQ/ExbB proton channel family protein [Candidatus Thiodiazotropha taylori]MCG7905871.1 MotA/TolQ/ExbB proton channel family protein [Candidatus Thiodiazotropha taylori]
MFELVKSGGWLMLPIIACSIAALGIVIERFWSLQRKRVMPDYLMRQILQLHQEEKLNLADLDKLKTSSPLGRILAAGLVNRNHSKVVMKEAIEEVGRQVVHELERYLNTLGTIASISPLLGLLGTVIGMIKVFSVIVTAGVGDPGVLAGGISEALITTAAGLSVAIPSLMFHRYFSGLIDQLVIGMEEQALKMVEVIHGERER